VFGRQDIRISASFILFINDIFFIIISNPDAGLEFWQ